MDTARDLACPALWQEALERSLARRGRSTRSSLELFNLRPERDLSHPELLRESLMYSQMRRSAASRRPSMALPSAGGISALALLAAATLPGLIGSRSGTRTGGERIAFQGASGNKKTRKASVAAVAANAAPTVNAEPAAGVAPPPADAVRIPAPAHLATPKPVAHRAQAGTISPSSRHTVRSSAPAHAPKHVAVARDASGGVAHAYSGGAAPAAHKPVAPKVSAEAPRVPANPQPAGHPRTGGRAIETTSHVRVTPSKPKAAPRHSHATSPSPAKTAPAHAPAKPHPVKAAPHPVKTTPHPVKTTSPPAKTTPKPVKPTPVKATPKPVARTHPVASAPKAPAPTPPPAASGRYVNPLANAHVAPERIDQGVDYSGSGTLGAVGNGKVTYVGTSGTGWPGAFVEYQLTAGAYSGRYVYYAESISPAAGLHVGQTVRAGQPIASINGGIEIGWGSGVGTQALAQADGQWSSGSDSGNFASADGKSFSALIAQLGGPPGKVEG